MQKSGHHRLAGAAAHLIYLYRNLPIHSKLHLCRFSPSCSQYAVNALRRFGILRGGWLILGRIVRCQPFASWGYDPLP